MWKKYLRWLRLNLHVLRLLLAGRWVSSKEVAESYDRIAPHYDKAWLQYLRCITDALLSRLPKAQPGRILDLGCGTGYTIQYLVEHYPGHAVIGVDISEKMLDQARKRLLGREVSFIHCDMLEYLAAQPRSSAAMIVLGWSIGYSKPRKIIKESARVLVPGGVLAFVVNYKDTLRPIAVAFRKCMARFPDKLDRVVLPRFPKKWVVLERSLRRHKLEVLWREEGAREISSPSLNGKGLLPWLRRTGVLAGFDSMIPLSEQDPVSEYFEKLIAQQDGPLLHQYVSALVRRP